MSAGAYFDAVIDALSKVEKTQRKNIDAAAGLLVEAIVTDKSLFSFGASHSFILTEEMVYRTGGLGLINPVYPHGMNLFVRPVSATSKIERISGLAGELLAASGLKKDDVLLIASTSGRNHVPIEMAQQARKLGAKTIGITSIDYSSGTTSRHPSGKKLMDLCDILIDNCAPYGDAAITIPGFRQRVSPLSTVTGCAIVNAMVAEVVARLVEQGVTPPVFISANLDEGEAHNVRLLSENAHRIHYM